jgi:hypothetical protein
MNESFHLENELIAEAEAKKKARKGPYRKASQLKI